MILKFTMNFRLGPDMNTSTSGEAIVDTPEEAREAGREFAALAEAFSEGLNEGFNTPREDSE